ncbi:unnamed protein product [Allacma fusca]|uniref:Endoplasmic reticulum transmembrane protein n=1 Tax=Allacma fusca TaxID=39272 RepID=A0A8J2L4S1_9HEXA|nr:unnamed protein product [Allacma fusca]
MNRKLDAGIGMGGRNTRQSEFSSDAIREMRNYSNEDYDLNVNPKAEMQAHMKLFRAQRNLYISGFALLLSFMHGKDEVKTLQTEINTLKEDMASLKRDRDAIKSQAESVSKEYDPLLE